MRRRALVGAVAMLGVVALIGLFASLFLLFSSPIPAYAQGTNSAPEFLDDNGDAITETTRNVNENTAAYDDIGPALTATDADEDRLTYSIQNAHTSPFTIVRSTGQLQVGQPLDHETQETYTVIVQVTDSEDADGNFEIPAVVDDTITVTITVNDLEEPGKISLSWTRPQPHANSAVTPTLTDPDGSVSVQSWKWQKLDNGWSDIPNVTSETYTPATGDVNKHIRAVATYTDRRASGKMAESETAHVRPVPSTNSAPDFQVNNSGGYSCPQGDAAETCVYARKSAAAGSEIYYPRYVYNTDNDQVQYSLSDTNTDSGDAELFRIDALKGDLYTTAAHIYDNPSNALPSNGKFRITITATDPSGLHDSIKVAIAPSGGGSPPVVVGPRYITFPENGTWPLASYSATIKAHIDANTNYSYIGWIIAVEPGGGDGDLFDIDDDGNLTFTQPPDYEDPADENGDNRYSFSLQVYETNPLNGQRPASSFFSVTVVVTDEKVEALEIDGPSAVRYAENGTGPVGTYSLLRANDDVDDWVLSGADADQFDIDDNTGELTFKRSPDYETPTDVAEENTYRVTITAYAGTESKTEFVFVRVTNVNEKPEFDEGETTTRTVERDAGADDLIGDAVNATDPDKNAELTYSLEATPAPPFQIDEWTGQLSVSGPIDQNQASYTMTVFVTDGQNADGETDTTADDRITVTVNVAGGGNSAPEFPSTETGARSIAENTTTVETVGAPVIAEDDDTDDTLTYALGGTDAGTFTIVDTSGQIKTKAGQTYDFETKPSYSVTVTADDSNGGTADKAVTITLNNVDEDGTVTLSPTQPAARSPVTATLTDPDGVTGTTTWQWSKSSDGSTGWTDVNANSRSYTPVDGDVNYYLRATASYTDGHGANKNAEAKTTAAVQTGTNRAPTFDNGLTTIREVAENTEAGENAGDPVEASDLDDDTLTYSLTGTYATSFTVDNTGQIKVGAATTLDYEAVKDSYTVIVRVHDNKDANGGPDTTIDATIVVTIDVTDLDEAGTVTLSTYQPTARAQVTATLTDPDGVVEGITIWQWAKADAQNGTYTDIGGQTSASYTPPDGDVGKFLKATASYTDGHGPNNSEEATTTSAVQSGTNRPPDFGATSTTRDVAENTAADQPVGDVVEATDADNDPLTYSLSGADSSLFDIDTGTGQVKVKTGTTLDYEGTRKSYTVVVEVTDSKKADGSPNAAMDDSIAVTITVTNVEEAGTVALSMTQPSVRTQLTATLTDPDGGVTGESWQWAKADAQAGPYSDINGETSANYTPDNGDVNKVLKAKVSYTDDHGQNKRAEAVSDNAVQAGANRPPTFSSGTVTRTVAENSGADIDVGSPVTATDLDTGSTLIYTLEGTDHDSFHVLSDSGQIQTKQGVTYDYETKQTYSVTVKADDGNSGTATKAVTINVTDAEDAGTVTLSTSQPVARTQLTATLSDQDGPVTSTTWVWERMLDPDDLTTHPWATITGATTDSYTPIDGDVNYYLRATATYTDSHEPNKTAAAVSANAVQSGVNRAPAFSAATATREFPENTGPGLKVDIPVGAADVDANDVLEYTLEGTDKDFFEIVPTDGQIKTKEGVTYDHEDRGSYSVTVKVDDKSGGTDTIDVTINVTDVNEKPSFTVTESVAFSIAENTSANTN